jgi:hypothetical protein
MSRILLRTLPLAAVTLAIAAAPAAAQRDRERGRERADASGYASRIDTTFAFARGGLVDAEQVAGDVIVTTWNRDEVRVRAYAQYGTLRSRFSRDRVWLRVEGEPEGRRNRRIGESHYEITVPAGTRVKLASVSGAVQVSGTRAEVEASSVSGDVSVSDTEGLTSVNSVSGDVTASRVAGDLALSSVSGDIEARDVSGDVRSTTVSGEITLRDLRSRSVSAKSTSGSLEYAGDFTRGGRYEFHSHSGDVTLHVPADAGLDVSMSTFSGSIDTDFAVTLGGGERRRAGRDMEFALNGGGARVSIETFSGDASLVRAGRGR